MTKKFLNFIKEHKITFVIILVALALSGYFGYTQLKKTDATASTYQVAKVSKGSIKNVVSGTGQVGDANQINISPEVSGEIIDIAVNLNDEVKAGDLIAEIDSSDLDNQIFQAQLAIKSANLNLEKMQEPADESEITKAENDITAAENSLAKLKLTQEHELETAQTNKKTIQNSIDDLSLSDPDYATKKATYKSQLKEAKYKLEELALSQPMAITEAEAKVEQAKQALENLKEGSSEDEIELQELSIQEKQSQLNDLYAQKADYTVTAPKDGVVALINFKEGEKFSGGNASSSSSALVVLLSKTKNATLAVNEVDVPSISLGQKVDLTFDALPDLSITGTVSQIDQIGTVSQSVVSNNITIAFDEQDDRIKNGMTVNADIIIQNKNDILILSSTAIKSSGTSSYVQLITDENVKISNSKVASTVNFKQTNIETGLSDDTNTEIISGLQEGDIVIVKTNTASTNTNSSKNTNSKSESSIMDMGMMSGGTGGPPN